jgi:class 3 adenylate cyclase/tetratricopeptide (TPR) repeat protein
VICSNCGTLNEGGRKFCIECASPLALACPNCGTANPPTAKFCGECATPLGAVGASVGPVHPSQVVGAVTAPASDASPVAERRLVSVLFADLVGFTPFAEERDAEDVRDTLSRYFELASDVITRYGGTVEKFIGDAVMAVWGAPTTREDDAERAVRAALELTDAVRSLGPEIQARAGVLTGQAAVTLGATNQGLVAGDLVNTASRLQSVAPPGTVLVGEATHRAASGAIVFEAAGEQLLKGKQAPVPAWRALRVVAERGGRNRSEGLEAPFVGRADELRLLKDLFHATGREKRPRLVSVMGPAGIGKSRLAWEFLKYVDGLVEDTYWHSGRSPAYGEGVTFWALGEMVRARCDLLETDDEPTTRRKVAETVNRWVTDDEERRWIEPALLALLGIESGIASEQLFGAWRTFFERIAAHGTVALVFEDLHSADSGLLDFIDHLLEWSRGVPLYVVTLARPELLDKRPDWGAGKRSFTSIHLEPLTDDQMREMLAGLVPGLPERAVKAIVGRAGGIPLYAVETVRMLVADGQLKEEGGAYVPIGDLTALAVPETLTALIASRLDSLAATERTTVHDAAVLGQSFTLDALGAVSGIAQDELESRLKTLVRRELLTQTVDPRSPELGQYVFVQALIREVAYNTLARRDRKTRHLAAARYFEQIGSDELAGALAGHYLAAYANAEGAEAEALAAQARIALKAAAERAVALGSHDQAISFVEQALTITADPADQAELLERAGRSANVVARADKADDSFRRASELYLKVGDRRSAARASGALGWSMLNAHRDQAALAHLKEVAAEYGDLWPDPVIVELKVQLARAHSAAEEHQRALELTDEALDVAEHADLVPTLARALVGKGGALGGLGRLRESIALIRAGEELARDNDLTETLLAALVVGGFFLGEVDQVVALEKYQEGLALARRTGQRGLMLQFVNNLGYTGFLVGDWSEALAELDAALAEDLDLAGRIWLLSNALIVRACRGEPVGDSLAELAQLASLHGDPNLELPKLDAQANAALAEGRLSDARHAWLGIAALSASQAPASLYQAARPSIWARDVAGVKADLATLDATGVHGRVVEIRRTTIRAGLAALEGRGAEAHSLYSDALRGWRDLRLVWDEALTAIDMASVLDPSERDVRAAADAARQILTRLRAAPFVERLDAAMERPAAGAPETSTLPSSEPATSRTLAG